MLKKIKEKSVKSVFIREPYLNCRVASSFVTFLAYQYPNFVIKPFLYLLIIQLSIINYQLFIDKPDCF